jgi:uncharacterized small protein (DUF1192 family)
MQRMEAGRDMARLMIVAGASSLLPFAENMQEEGWMDPDELEPKKKPPAQKLLDPMSIGELEVYIGELQREIERVHAAIAAKRAVRSGADSLFKK